MNKRFISYKEASKTRCLVTLSFEKSGYDILFKMSKSSLNKLYKYINGELSIEDNSHVTFNMRTFQIIDRDTKNLYIEGKDFSLVLNSLYDGELKINVMGVTRGSNMQTIIGTLKVVYEDENPSISEKML